MENKKIMNWEDAKKIASKYAKGDRQYYLLLDLLTTGSTAILRGYMKAQSYYSNYIRSFANVIDRLEKGENMKINYVPGKLGGSWTAFYEIAA